MPRERKETPKQEIIKRYKARESLRDICRDYDISYSTLYRRIQEWDVERDTDIRKLDLPDREIISMYQKGMSCQQISDNFECSSSAISRRLKENDIKIRGPKSVDIDEEELKKKQHQNQKQ